MDDDADSECFGERRVRVVLMVIVEEREAGSGVWGVDEGGRVDDVGEMAREAGANGCPDEDGGKPVRSEREAA